MVSYKKESSLSCDGGHPVALARAGKYNLRKRVHSSNEYNNLWFCVCETQFQQAKKSRFLFHFLNSFFRN